MKFRDKNDSERKIAPLRKAEDAASQNMSRLTGGLNLGGLGL